MTSSTRIILVRHGRSTYNDQGRYQGSSNHALLTQKGIETACQVGQSLRHVPIHAVYSSPLRRVTQTTDTILRELGTGPKALSIDENLREIDLSNWEGLSYQHVKEQFAEDYRCWQEQPHEFELTRLQAQTRGSTAAVTEVKYYPVRSLYQRAQQFWQTVLTQHAGQTVLVVSHGGTNHALISTALGLTPEHHHRLQQSNCGVSILEFTNWQVQIQQLNCTASIKETLPKLKAGKQGLQLLLVAEEALSKDRAHTLADRLAAIAPNFCLASREDLARKLLQRCPTTLQLATTKASFLLDWQQSLEQSVRHQSKLITGIAIAPTRSIQTLLMQTLGGQAQNSSQIRVESGKLSVVHYPSAHRPVVQAINF
ncbi:MAG: histidine phosphatase family protein [Phormidesmis sp. RL_2_1]|nr:histidine phosphatase family protein [Phormidesmis sp. RL_2_1]